MKLNAPQSPKGGEERFVSWFAWLPVQIHEDLRWLETVYVRQEYNEYAKDWVNLEFIDNEPKLDVPSE